MAEHLKRNAGEVPRRGREQHRRRRRDAAQCKDLLPQAGNPLPSSEHREATRESVGPTSTTVKQELIEQRKLPFRFQQRREFPQHFCTFGKDGTEASRIKIKWRWHRSRSIAGPLTALTWRDVSQKSVEAKPARNTLARAQTEQTVTRRSVPGARAPFCFCSCRPEGHKLAICYEALPVHGRKIKLCSHHNKGLNRLPEATSKVLILCVLCSSPWVL